MENKKTGNIEPHTPSSMSPNAGSHPSTPARRRRYVFSSRAAYDMESSDETPETTSEPINRTSTMLSPDAPTFLSRRLWGSLHPSSSSARGPSGSSTSATRDEDSNNTDADNQVFKTLRSRVVYVTPAKKRKVSVITEPNQETEPRQETGSEPEMAIEPQGLVKAEPESPRVTMPELDLEMAPESETDSETDPAPVLESNLEINPVTVPVPLRASASASAPAPTPEKESQPQTVPSDDDSDGSSIILTADSKAPTEVIDLISDSD